MSPQPGRPGMTAIEHYLKSCRELARCCSRRGLIDTDSLHYRVLVETSSELVVDVEFDEVLPEGPSGEDRRIPCRGQLHLLLDRVGRIVHTEVL
jgi:hypothetical protein